MVIKLFNHPTGNRRVTNDLERFKQCCIQYNSGVRNEWAMAASAETSFPSFQQRKRNTCSTHHQTATPQSTVVHTAQHFKSPVRVPLSDVFRRNKSTGMYIG